MTTEDRLQAVETILVAFLSFCDDSLFEDLSVRSFHPHDGARAAIQLLLSDSRKVRAIVSPP